MKKIDYSKYWVPLVSYTFIILFATACVLPFILMLSSSITDEFSLLEKGFRLLPSEVSFVAYEMIIRSGEIFKAYGVTIIVTIAGTALSLLLTSGLSYAVSVKKLKYRTVITFFVYFTMLFSGGLVPSYILIAKYLNMKNTLWVLFIPVLVSPWNMFLLRNFFNTIPTELSESAEIDGANPIQIMYKIVLPISKPALATIGLFYGLAYWNEWFRAMLYIDEKDMFPLQYLIMRIMKNITFADQIAAESGADVGAMVPNMSARFATAILTIGPIVFIYPFVQKYFVKGLTVGAIKG